MTPDTLHTHLRTVIEERLTIARAAGRRGSEWVALTGQDEGRVEHDGGDAPPTPARRRSSGRGCAAPARPCPVRRPCLDLAQRTHTTGVIMGGRDFIDHHPTSARARQHNTPAGA
jgi:hypothetical protein